MFRLLAVLAALASIPTSALAAPEPNPPIPSVYAMPAQPRTTVAATTLDGTPTAYTAPAVLEVPAADQATLRAGGSPVVYFVQQPVAAPAAPVEPKATVSAGDTGGFLGKVGGIVGIFGFLGMGLLVLFRLWTGEKSTAVRMAVINAAEAAWYSGEAVGGPTGAKIKASSEAFLKGMEALGIKPDAQQLALRDAAFESMSKADKVTKARLAALVAPAKVSPSDPQTPLAGS